MNPEPQRGGGTFLHTLRGLRPSPVLSAGAYRGWGDVLPRAHALGYAPLPPPGAQNSLSTASDKVVFHLRVAAP